jgi:hypothetical protein
MRQMILYSQSTSQLCDAIRDIAAIGPNSFCHFSFSVSGRESSEAGQLRALRFLTRGAFGTLLDRNFPVAERFVSWLPRG